MFNELLKRVREIEDFIEKFFTVKSVEEFLGELDARAEGMQSMLKELESKIEAAQKVLDALQVAAVLPEENKEVV
jgi:hypothetical protein